MKKKHEKLMADLQRILENQDFKSKEEMEKFMTKLIGKEIPSFPKEILNIKEQAQELVFEANSLSPAKGKAKIEKALQLDPDCIEAYEYLGSIQRTAEIAATFYEKGIQIGHRLFGGKYLKKHKGMFWGFHEIRPFMRCMQQYASCLNVMDHIKECAAVLEEIIELNPNDNQGARDQLFLCLLQLNDHKKFVKYNKQYEDDDMAFPLFNRALFAFKTVGESENANKQLNKAIAYNKFVAKRLLSNKRITEMPQMYSFGDENEAIYYVNFAQHVWKETNGATAWLKKISVL